MSCLLPLLCPVFSPLVWVRTLMHAKVYVSRVLQDTLTVWNTHKQFLFLYVHQRQNGPVVGTINRFIPSGYVQSACWIPLGSKFTDLYLDLETFGLDLEHLWPWPRRPLASGLDLNNAVLKHTPRDIHRRASPKSERWNRKEVKASTPISVLNIILHT